MNQQNPKQSQNDDSMEDWEDELVFEGEEGYGLMVTEGKALEFDATNSLEAL